MGKPVTVGHPGLVRADNIASIKPIGTVLSPGKQDGDQIRADLVIYNLDTKNRELSCGYNLDVDETPGEWEGQKYDAIQRNIRYNHVAVVPRARAGPYARLNMDGDQYYFDEEDKKTMKIRLDGIEYEAAPEVINALDKANKRADEAESKENETKKQLDAVTAEKDGLQAKVDSHAAEIEKTRKDAADILVTAVKSRVELLKTADDFHVDKADEMADKEIKVAVIKSVRGDSFDLTDKSDAYIDAAFDLAKADKRSDAMADQRQKLKQLPGSRNDENDGSSAGARQRMIDNQQNAYKGGND